LGLKVGLAPHRGVSAQPNDQGDVRSKRSSDPHIAAAPQPPFNIYFSNADAHGCAFPTAETAAVVSACGAQDEIGLF
jgi:hypothetical protein